MARDQARSAPTYKDPGSCYLKYFPEKPPSCSLGLSGLSLVCEYVQTPWERRIRATPSKTDFDVLHGFTFQKAATANWHCRFLQRHPLLQSEAKLLVTGHRPRHDLAAGIGAIPDVAVANIPTECWFIQKFKDEINIIGALVPQEEPFGVENIHLPISVPYRVQLTPGGGAKLRPTIS